MYYDSVCCFRNSTENMYRILWEITSKCNQNCIFCHSRSTDYISLEQAKKILDNIKELPIKDIILTGGEPLLNKHIFDIMQEIKKRGYEIDLCTNGSLINENNILQLKKYLTEISISLDSIKPEVYKTIRGVDQYYKVIQGIKLLIENDIEVHLTCVLNKYNVDEIEMIIDEVEKLQVNSISLLNLIIDISKDTDISKKIKLSPEQENKLIEKINNKRRTSKIKINTKRLIVKEEHLGCKAGKNILGITSNGKLVSCIMHDNKISVNVCEEKITKDKLNLLKTKCSNRCIN